MKKRTKQKPIALAAYARHRKELGLVGGTPAAVSKAVFDGRLKKSVVRVGGKKKIVDADLADQEWEANTQSRIDHAPRVPAGDAARRSGGPGDPTGELAQAMVEALIPDYFESRAKKEAAGARREAALADLAEIEVAERREELVPVEDVESRLVAVFSQCRNKLLGVPSRARQQDPALSMPQIALFESLIREALEDLTVDGGGA